MAEAGFAGCPDQLLLRRRRRVRNALRSTRHAAAIRLADLGVVVPTERSAEVALWVSDVNHHYELAVQVGAKVIRPPMDAPDGRLRYAWFTDPERHQIRLLKQLQQHTLEERFS